MRLIVLNGLLLGVFAVGMELGNDQINLAVAACLLVPCVIWGIEFLALVHKSLWSAVLFWPAALFCTIPSESLPSLPPLPPLDSILLFGPLVVFVALIILSAGAERAERARRRHRIHNDDGVSPAELSSHRTGFSHDSFQSGLHNDAISNACTVGFDAGTGMGTGAFGNSSGGISI